jgi:uncharacterized protein
VNLEFSWRRVLIGVAVTMVIGYAAMVGALWAFQRPLLFQATHNNPPFESLGLEGASRVVITTPDREKLASLYRPAPAGRPTVIYFHGKGGEVSNVASKLRFLSDHGFGYLGVGYRGFGGSTGSPTERGLIIDAVANYDWLRQQGVSEQDIFVLGESLGTGVAVQLAAQRKISALVLGAPYTSIADVAASRYWFAPVRMLMLDEFASAQVIGSVTAPLLVVHGTADKTVPFKFGKALYELANEPKQFQQIEGRGHEILTDRVTWNAYLDFLESIKRVGSQG